MTDKMTTTELNAKLENAIKCKQNDECLRLIRLGANINHIFKCEIYNCNNITPLFLAIIYMNFDACKILIENGADLDWKNIHNMSLLHLACVHTIGISICELLVDNGADVLATNTFGERPSAYCKCGSVKYHYLKQKEEERDMMNMFFKRAHIEDDNDDAASSDEEEPELKLEDIYEES